MCGALLLLLGAACATQEEECLPCRAARTAEIRLGGTLPAGELRTELCLFRRAAGTQAGYVYDRSLGAVADGDVLKLPLSELRSSDYRFLAVAQPAADAWLTTGADDGTALAPGTAWERVRLSCTGGEARLDGYCGVADIPGETVLSEERISVTLTRVAGQMLFDFFRIGASLAEPVGVVSADVESVLDRVMNIEITYRRPTTALRFDAENRLVPAAYASEPLTQRVEPALTDFRVPLPQADRGLTLYDAAYRGSARLEGAVLLPSDAQLRAELVFTYYDTTPACDNDHTGAHVASCFRPRQVTLQLPAAASSAGLPVDSDCFTVNRAGLHADRIIDIPLSGGVVTNFDWLKY